MVLKSIVPLVMGVALMAGTAMADEYRPDEFLTLDLPKAVLSPKPLGPEQHFLAVPVEASSAHAAAAVQPSAKPDVPRAVAAERVHVAHSVVKAKSMARPVATARGAARTRLAHRHGNPLDAQAMDTRIQTWPCKPGNGGICAWKQ
jgi:hypothetical protein